MDDSENSLLFAAVLAAYGFANKIEADEPVTVPGVPTGFPSPDSLTALR